MFQRVRARALALRVKWTVIFHTANLALRPAPPLPTSTPQNCCGACRIYVRTHIVWRIVRRVHIANKKFGGVRACLSSACATLPPRVRVCVRAKVRVRTASGAQKKAHTSACVFTSLYEIIIIMFVAMRAYTQCACACIVVRACAARLVILSSVTSAAL